MKHALLALALAASAGAHATSTDWGDHDAIEFSGIVARFGPFLDTFAFSLDDASTVASVLGALALTAPTYSLWSNPDTVVGNGDDTFIASWGANTGAHSLLLGAGDFFYAVGGAGPGVYALASTIVSVQAVPEPERYVMLLAGLGAVGFVVRRRR